MENILHVLSYFLNLAFIDQSQFNIHYQMKHDITFKLSC